METIRVKKRGVQPVFRKAVDAQHQLIKTIYFLENQQLGNVARINLFAICDLVDDVPIQIVYSRYFKIIKLGRYSSSFNECNGQYSLRIFVKLNMALQRFLDAFPCSHILFMAGIRVVQGRYPHAALDAKE